MLVREVQTEDLEKINNFLILNNKKPIKLSTWNYIFLNNPHLKNVQKISKGWVVEDNKVIVGYVGNFPKVYKKEEKVYLASVFTTWVVNEKYRYTSILLLTEYFKQNNVDIFINTTANLEASKIWKAMGAQEVPLNSCKEVKFQILNSENFLKTFFYLKNIKLNKYLIKLFKSLFNTLCIIKLNFYKIHNENFNSKIVHEIDAEIGNMINNSDLHKNYFSEIFGIKNLTWNIDYRKKDKEYWITKIYDNSRLVGFSICFGEVVHKSNLKKCSFSFIYLANDKNSKHFNHLINHSIKTSKMKKYDVIEFRNLNSIYTNYIKKFYFFRKKYINNPYLYRVNKNNFGNFDFLKKKECWNVSLLDGDILF